MINDRWGKDSRHKHGGYWTTEYTPGMRGLDHPWEESRGMGFSYGYNRAERLEHYRTTRGLVLTLVDLVSRGGNLLLDIGPGADGTIPVVMEERLIEMGDCLEVNGEAIYGTKPWNRNIQWGSEQVLEVEYNKEFGTAYDLKALVEGSAAGVALLVQCAGEVYRKGRRRRGGVAGVERGHSATAGVRAQNQPVRLGAKVFLVPKYQ